MFLKPVKKTLTGLLLLITCFIVLMLIPRTWSALNPKKPPMGYYFETPTFIALKTGLESFINKVPAIPDNVEEIKNIEYKNINGESLMLDIYRPKNMTAPAPLLVFIHGGSWRSGNRADYLIYLAHFASLGYVTATISYRFLQVAPYPACVEDIQDARHFIFENGQKYNYDTSRICFIGSSAGAHLSLLTAYGWKSRNAIPDSTRDANQKKEKIKAVVELYGPIDFTSSYAKDHPSITNFMAHTYKETPELFVEASPLTWVSKESPVTMIVHGTRDMLVPLLEAEKLKHKLDSLGVPNVYHPVPGWPHAMELDQRVNDYCKVILLDFFEKYVK